jgi:hypothetical protein
VSEHPADPELVVRFTYHPPTTEQAERMSQIREACLFLAKLVHINTPVSREQELAFTAIEQVSMWANAAIARREGRTDA